MFIKSIIEIEERILDWKKCQLCCYAGNVSIQHIQEHHMKKAVSCKWNDHEGYALMCKLPCRGLTANKGHFHCPECKKSFVRGYTLRRHLKEVHLQNKIVAVKVQRKYRCKICKESFLQQHQLDTHCESAHPSTQTLPAICVDRKNGIFMVANRKSGLLAPIHVKSHKLNQVQMCGNEDCNKLMTCGSLDNPAAECLHLKSVGNAIIPQVVSMKPMFLDELVKMKVISSESTSKYLKILEESVAANSPLVVHTDFASFGCSTRMQYYSVYTGKQDYYSKFKRVRVTLDTTEGVWSCKCPYSGERQTCQHETLVKWYCCQTSKSIFKAERSFCCLSKDDEFLMEYYLKSKSIPELLPCELLTERSPPAEFVPAEIGCPRCSFDLKAHSSVRGTVYGCGKLWRGIDICVKHCCKCKLKVRFQEYATGFHNFNNHTIVSLSLCHYLLRAVQNHVCVESALNMIFIEEIAATLPHDKIRNAFYHFCALSKRGYQFSCVICGPNPKVIIGDGNWKNTCQVSTECLQIKKQHKDTVDIEKQWTLYCQEIIGRGFYGTKENPWTVKVAYDSIAPWMGANTRASKELVNTEHQKVAVLNCSKVQQSKNISGVSQEEILEALHSHDTSASKKLKVICKSLGIDNSGSVEDLVNRLNELILFKEIYPKMFQHLKKCGGGIVHFRCIHGIAVYMKFTLRQESARDYIDGVLSFAQQPSVIVTDIAAQVAHHGENRKADMFSPNKGMLYEWTKENLQLAQEGKLMPVKLKLHCNSNKYYSLNDKFHHHTKKRSAEKAFRNLRLVSDLSINSSIAEQSNAVMKKDRLSMDLRNTAINRVNLRRAKRDFGSFAKVLECTAVKSDDMEIDPLYDGSVQENQNISNEKPEDHTELVQEKQDAVKEQALRTTEKENNKTVKEEATKNKSLEELWKEKSHNMVVAILKNPTLCVLRHSSFCTLAPNNWLDTSVIEYVLRQIASTNEFTFILDSFVVNLIIDRKTKVLQRHGLKKIAFSDFKIIMGAYNKNDNHWNLFVANMETTKIYLIDPFGFRPASDVVASFRKYLGLRKNIKDIHLITKPWKLGEIMHPLQTDTHSCGVFVLKIAEQLTQAFNETISFQVSSEIMRKYFAQLILKFSENLDNVCYACGETTLVGQWIGCDTCSRWYHSTCISLGKKTVEDVKKILWRCPVCK